MYILDDILEEMANEGKVHFSPHYICTRAGLNDLKAVTEYLLKLVDIKLIVNFEVECPEGDSDFAVKNPSEIKMTSRSCHICNREYLPNPDRVWIIFDFLPSYIDYSKKKRENRNDNIEIKPLENQIVAGTTVGELLRLGMKIEQFNLNMYIGNGEVFMDNSKKMGSINNSNLDNVVIQSEYVNLNKVVGTDEFAKAYEILLTEISKLPDEATREQAQYNAEELKSAAEENDTGKVGKLLKFLGKSLGTSSSVLTIAGFFGIPNPF